MSGTIDFMVYSMPEALTECTWGSVANEHRKTPEHPVGNGCHAFSLRKRWSWSSRGRH